MAGGMANMQQMMRKMQKLQEEMEKEQKNLETKEFQGSEPSGMIKVTVTGDRRLKAININPEAVDPEDVDMLQDLLLDAVNDGLAKVDAETANTMGKYTKGIPGL
jgi:DNA-binding YbaB/EbfC family protein